MSCRSNNVKEYKLVINGKFPSLNQFIEANRVSRGNWNKGNQMKQEYQYILCCEIKKQLKNVKIDNPIIINYTFYEPNKKRDLDNISSFFHKIFQDGLVFCEVIKNDNWNYIIGFSDLFKIDKENPRIEITLAESKR